MKTIYLGFLLAMFNFSLGVPPARRYGYGNEDAGYRAPGGFGPRFGTGAQGYGDHANWCPMRAREALRPQQRLPPMSRSQGPGYFNYASDDESLPRYGRSQRTNSNTRQRNDFTDVDNSNMDDGGVNVGGVLWPRRTTSKTDSTIDKIDSEDRITEGGCRHHKVATLAKDATAAAADAASAAASAAKSAAKATAAAACNPDGIPDDIHIQDDTESDESDDVKTDVEYQEDEVNSQDNVESGVISQGNSEDYQGTTDGGVNTSDKLMHSQGTTDSGTNSQSTGREIYSQRAGRVVNSQSTTGSEMSSHSIGENSQSTTGSGIHSKASTDSGMNSRSGSGIHSQGTNSSGVNSQGTLGRDVNSQGFTNDGGYSQSTKSGANSKQDTDSRLKSRNDKVSEGHDGIREEVKKNVTSTDS